MRRHVPYRDMKFTVLAQKIRFDARNRLIISFLKTFSALFAKTFKSYRYTQDNNYEQCPHSL
jgi:hypothetical protein